MPTIPPPLTGLIVVALLYAVIGALSGQGLGWLSSVVTGADGRASTSKFQLLLWTSIVLWAYPTLVPRGFQDGALPGFLTIPGNVMLLMGLGTGTAATGGPGATPAPAPAPQPGLPDAATPAPDHG